MANVKFTAGHKNAPSRTWDTFVIGTIIEFMVSENCSSGLYRMVTSGGLVNLDDGKFVSRKTLEGTGSPFHYRALHVGDTITLSNKYQAPPVTFK